MRFIYSIFATLVLNFYPHATEAGVVLDPTEVAAWSDKTFNRLFSEHRFSGLAIAVTQGGEIIFSRGYGFEDYVNKVPVDPAETRFRIGSNSKIFTATALMQLKDRGLIDSLDDPANQYLKRTQLPDNNGKEITLLDLFTHQAGFEDLAEGLGMTTEQPDFQSREVTESLQPAIVRPTGLLSSYSNYSTSILGAILEDLTGMTTQDYLQANIFTPLGMDRSVLNYSTEPTERLGQTIGFFPSGEAQVVPHIGIHPFVGPAGAINATVEDIARFQMAHLDAGKTAENPILSPESFALMQTRHRGNHPATSGFGVQAVVGQWNEEKVFGHGGGWIGAQSIMMMLPNSDMSFFIATMGNDPSAGLLEQIASLFTENRMTPRPGVVVERPIGLTDLFRLFMNRFVGEVTPSAGTPGGDLEKYVGRYWQERRSQSRREGILEVFGGGVISVGLHPQDGLSLNGVGPYKEVAKGVFHRPLPDFLDYPQDWPGIVAFTLDAEDQPIRAQPFLSIDTYSRVEGPANPATMLNLGLISTLLCLSGFLSLFWWRSKQENRARWLSVVIAALALSLPLFLLAGFPEGYNLGIEMLSGRGVRFGLLQAGSNLLALLALVSLWVLYGAWKNHYWGQGWWALVKRLHFSLVTLGALGMIPVLIFGNQLGF